MTKIDINNYELYFLRYIEDRLSAKERAEVEAFLAEHPELQEVMDLYDPAFTLTKDDDLVFADKDLLTHAKPVKVLPMWVKYSSVAAVALLLLLIGGLWLQRGDAVESVIVAKNQGNADTILDENIADKPVLLAENERKPILEPAENIVDNSFKANDSKVVATADETESDIEEEDNVTDVNNIMNVIDDNSTVEYYAENVVEDTPQKQDDETDETVVIEIYSDALAEIVGDDMEEIAEATAEKAEDNVDDEPVVIEEYSYALAIYVVDVNSDYQYNTDRYDTGLAEYAIVDKREEVKEMFAQFSEMTSTLFKRRKEKAEKELMAFANILVSEYNNTKEKINYYIAENVNK